MHNRYKVKVSVLIPCRNEATNIENCIKSIFDFDTPDGGYEVIVIDGMSDDGTREVIFRLMEQFPELMLIDNPKKTAPHAMNLGINHSHGEYIVRTDPRCNHPKRYLIDLLELSEQTGGENVGGVLEAVGNTYTQKSIASAYVSPIAVGAALGSWGSSIKEVDDVYGGCFKKEFLLKVGSYDENMVRNQDDELSFRIRKAGGRIFQSGRIRVQYYPRNKFVKLFKQFMQYGYWKVIVIKKHPKQASWRHVAPSMLVLGFLLFGAFSFSNDLIALLLLIYSGVYFFSLFFESLRITLKSDIKLLPGVALSICLMHLGYGTGFIMGLISLLFGLKFKWFESLSR